MSISDWRRKTPVGAVEKEKEKFLMKQEMININANLLAEPIFQVLIKRERKWKLQTSRL